MADKAQGSRILQFIRAVGADTRLSSLFLAGAALVIAMPSELLHRLRDDLSKLSGQTITTLSLLAAGTVFIGLFAVGSLAEKVFIESSGRPKRNESKDDTSSTSFSADPIEYYRELTDDSRKVARTLFSRSGVFLIVGVMTAVFGVLLFITARNLTAPVLQAKDLNHLEYAAALLQNAGILLISELIAFFFLRQSRSVLDEFRHADQIARNREEVLSLILLAPRHDSPSIKEIVDSGRFFTRGERLSAGESTEIVEGRKLEKSEIDLLGKIADVIAATRK